MIIKTAQESDFVNVKKMIDNSLENRAAQEYNDLTIEKLKLHNSIERMRNHDYLFISVNNEDHNKIYGSSALTEDEISMFYIPQNFTGFKAANQLMIHTKNIGKKLGYDSLHALVLSTVVDFTKRHGGLYKGETFYQIDDVKFKVHQIEFPLK